MKQLVVFSVTMCLLFTGCTLSTQPLTNASQAIEQTVNAEHQKQVDKTQAKVKCQQLCQNEISSDGQDFERGPCLSNLIAPDWVCDVAHSPRQPADDEPANQCSAFREGKAHHYVEVDGNCNVIQAR